MGGHKLRLVPCAIGGACGLVHRLACVGAHEVQRAWPKMGEPQSFGAPPTSSCKPRRVAVRARGDSLGGVDVGRGGLNVGIGASGGLAVGGWQRCRLFNAAGKEP